MNIQRDRSYLLYMIYVQPALYHQSNLDIRPEPIKTYHQSDLNSSNGIKKMNFTKE